LTPIIVIYYIKKKMLFMVESVEQNDEYFILEKNMKKARENIVILTFPLFIALLALYGLNFHTLDFISTMMWIFGGAWNPLLISFSRIFLIIFPIFISVVIVRFCSKYISSRRKITQYFHDYEIEE